MLWGLFNSLLPLRLSVPLTGQDSTPSLWLCPLSLVLMLGIFDVLKDHWFMDIGFMDTGTYETVC